MAIPVRDPALADVLAAGMGVQEVCGPDGRLLGRFIPEPRPGVSCPEFGITDEEILRRVNDRPEAFVTGEQVVARLREIDRCTP